MSDLEPDFESALRATLAERAAAAPAGDGLPDTVSRRGRVRRTHRRITGAVAVVALGAAAVGVAASDLNPFGGDGDVVAVATDPVEEELISCGPGGPRFDPALLVERPPLDPDSELGAAVQASPPPVIEARMIDGWTLIEEVGTTAHLMIWLDPEQGGTDMAGSAIIAASYERGADGAWTFQGLGGCEPQRAFDDGLDPATWALAGSTPGPEATSVTILVTEIGCASGQSSADRLTEPIVEYRDDAVLITTRVEPPSGTAFDCQGNPPSEITVQLTEPLGDRELLDGMWVPARPVRENTQR